MAHPQDLQAELLEEIQQLRMEQTVQRMAYVALALHLAVRGCADLNALSQDLTTLSQAQPEPDWQAGLQALAGVLHAADELPSTRQTKRPHLRE